MGTVQTFSACLREILNRRGISASELSRRMGFSSRTSVFRLLNGETSHEKQREFVKRLEELNALALTPEQLPVLKEAGVVDSGGKGLLTIYRGFKLSMDGEEAADYEEIPVDAAVISSETELTEENITFGYCTEFFIIHLNPSFQESDLDNFREHLMRIGDSVVAAYDSDMIKVHVHSDAPGKVLQMALLQINW